MEARAEIAPRAGGARIDLKRFTRDELRSWAEDALGERAFRGDQIFRWLHGRGARDFEAMTDLGKPLRARLGAVASPGGLALEGAETARDGTRKLLLRTAEGRRIESVIILMNAPSIDARPDGAPRVTQCVSSQIGCKMACDFCLTARMAPGRNLRADEIVDQVLWGQRVLAEAGLGVRITNLVYMGMGEPLDNYAEVTRSIRLLMDPQGQAWSGRRITVSTSGVVPRIAQLGQDLPVNLAISLNATTEAQRDRLMPINRRWPIATLFDALRAFPLPPRRRITVEYVLLEGVNDAMDDARRLAHLVRGLPSKINLIPFNAWPGAPYGRPSEAAVEAFGRTLRDARVHVTIRASKGADIGAACGQLDGNIARA